MKVNFFQKLKSSLMITIFVMAALFSKSSEAMLTVTFEQIGNNVVASSSGSIILGSGCCNGSEIIPYGQLNASVSSLSINLGSLNQPIRHVYVYGRGDPEISTGPLIVATSSIGDPFGFYIAGATMQNLIIPANYNYTSGESLIFTTTWENKSLSDLYLTPKSSYSWKWNYSNGDDLRIIVKDVAAPVPAPLPILGAVAALGWSRKLRSRIKNAKNFK